MLEAIEGLRVGHWTDARARTGCTVVLCPPGTVASGEVRGGAPATREFALLEPGRMVDGVDAVVLTGGSAFGLAAADGVVGHLAERGRGFVTPAGPVPIVVAMGLFDLLVGDPSVHPGAVEGALAARRADGDEPPDPAGLTVWVGDGVTSGTARVGAGAGACFGLWRGEAHQRDGGVGWSVLRHGGVSVAAMIAVNAFGGPAGELDLDDPLPDEHLLSTAALHPGQNTTIGIIATDAPLDKMGANLLAQSGHDGLARALAPAHTLLDGDALVTLATGTAPAVDIEVLRHLSASAVQRAIQAVTA